MTHRLVTQAAAFGLALATTLAMMAGIQGLATPDADGKALARGTTPAAPTVVVTGKRLPHA